MQTTNFDGSQIQLPKIAIAELPSWVRPAESPFLYPPYAKDVGIEQDFLKYLKLIYPKTVQDFHKADFIYLPVFWTRLHLTNDYGRSGLAELQEAVNPWLTKDVKTFTICQYDDGPLVELQESMVFLGSRQTKNGLDVPLLASPMPKQLWNRKLVNRDIKASFSGRLATHSIRQQLIEATSEHKDIYFSPRSLRPRSYAALLARSKLALSPRGYGGSSFRFFEALQMGAVPWLIGEEDVRPFKSQIDWDSISFYSKSVEDFIHRFEELTGQDIDQRVTNVSLHSDSVWRLGAWCHLLVRELQFIQEGP